MTSPKFNRKGADSIPRYEDMTPVYTDPEVAFDKAIDEGRLSANTNAPLYAGHYMYMGTFDGVDTFKHHMTREYIT